MKNPLPILARPWFFPAAILLLFAYLPLLFHTTILRRTLDGSTSPVWDGIGGRLDDPSFWIVLGVLGASTVTLYARNRAFRSIPGQKVDAHSLGFALDSSATAWVRIVWIPVLQTLALLTYTFIAREQLGVWLRPGVNLTWATWQSFEGFFNIGAIWLGFLCLIYIRSSLHHLAYSAPRTAPPMSPHAIVVTRNWLRHAPWFASTITLGIGMFWISTIAPSLVPPLPPPNPIIGSALENALLFATFALYTLPFFVCGLWHLNDVPQVRRDICHHCGYSLAGIAPVTSSVVCSECGTKQ